MPVNWDKLIELAVPAVGQIASGAPHGSFLTGWQQGQQIAAHERTQQAEQDRRQHERSADYVMQVGQQALALEDPVLFAQFLDLADRAGAKAGFTEPGELKGQMQFPSSRVAARQLGDLTRQLDALEKSGYDLIQLAEGGAVLQGADGQSVPIAQALEVTRRVPHGADGLPIAPQPKVTPAATETERIAQLRTRLRQAMERGDGGEADRLQAELNDYLETRRSMNPESDRPVPRLSGTEDYFDALVSLWQQSNPGRDLPPDVRAQLRLRANKEMGDSGRADRGPGGLAPGQEFSMSERLASAWRTANGSYREMQRQYTIMQTGLTRFRQGDKNGGSQAVLVTFQKILDPTSVVRESEYARSAEGVSVLSRIEGYAERLKSGGAGVPDAELAGMVETARQFLEELKSNADGQRRRIEAQASRYQLDPATIFDDVLLGTGRDTGGVPPPVDTTTSGPRIGERRTINGQMGEWDGRGWKAVP